MNQVRSNTAATLGSEPWRKKRPRAHKRRSLTSSRQIRSAQRFWPNSRRRRTAIGSPLSTN
ncbi:MAG: hypothetical protein CMM59_23310, partial [Rhodospirillaceae bacterium]|nr:hypothetical protein [Rhodospirillaceae bacterium]